MVSQASQKTRTSHAKRRRAVFRLIGIPLIIGISFPLWFGALAWLVVRVADIGAQARVQSVGYAALTVRGLDFGFPGVQIEAETISAPTPLGWVWARLTSRPESAATLIDHWRVRVNSEEMSDAETTETSPRSAFEYYPTFRDQLRRWAPSGTLQSGRIEMDGSVLLVERLDWTRERITASLAMDEAGRGEIDLSIDDPENIAVSVSGEFEGQRFQGTASLGPKDGLLWGEARAETELGTATIEGGVGLDEWSPKSVELTLSGIEAPSAMGADFGSLDIEGSGRAVGAGGQFEWEVVLNQRGEASPDSEVLATMGATTTFDRRDGRIEAFFLKTAWVDMALDEPVDVRDSNGNWRWPEARLSLQSASDVSIEGLTLSSPLKASIQLSETGGRLPRVEVSGAGAFPVTEKIGEARVDVDAFLEWPEIAITRLNVAVGETSQLRLSGDYDAEALRVSNVEMTGAVRLSELMDWDTESDFLDRIELEAKADGELLDLQHSGRLKTLGQNASEAPGVDLEFQWRGQGIDQGSAIVQGRASGIQCLIDAAIRRGEDEVEIAIPRMEYGPVGVEPLALEAPFRVQLTSFQSGLDGAHLQWESLRLSGSGRSIEFEGDVTGASQGNARALVEKISRDWLPIPPAIEVDDFAVDRALVDIGWELGEIQGLVQVDGNAAIGDRNLEIELDAASRSSGLRIEQARISIAEGAGVEVSGGVPLNLRVDETGFRVESDPDSQLNLQGRVDVGGLLDEELPSDIGLKYTDMAGRFTVSGNVTNPKMDWGLSAGAIEWRPESNSGATWSVNDLRFDGALTRRSVDIKEIAGRLEGSPFRVTASIPFESPSADDLLTALGTMAVDWNRLTASIELEPARLFDPAIELGVPVYPGGTIEVDLDVRPSFGVFGDITLDSLSFGPISTLGSFRDFSGRLLFEGGIVRAQEFAGEYKGRPVTLSGKMPLPRPDTEWKLAGDYSARLQTTGIPLAQQSGLIVRSDIDLTLRNSEGNKPEISGTVRLRDGLLLANANELFTPGAISPEQRPPFFAVDVPPFDEWELNVSVVGERFLKAKTPVFQGEISSDLKLSRTLGAPQAIGELRIENGTARFPFAKLDITRGSVRLTPENPYQPALDALAVGRLYGYDITARVSGGVDDPRVRLESSPPLRPEAILLMLTTGESPRDTVRISSAQKRSRLAMYFGNSVLDQLGLGGGDRVSVRTGEDVTVDGRVTTALEYRLNDIWAATIEYDRFNAVNAGMKFRIISR